MTIPAHVQYGKVHLCSVAMARPAVYSGSVGKAQIPDSVKALAVGTISRWRDAVLENLGWSGANWAKKAGVSATTITRTMAPDYKSSTSIETLHILAHAAGLPSVLDFLDGQIEGGREELPSESVLASAFVLLLASIGIDPHEDGRAQKLAQSFPDALRIAKSAYRGHLTNTEDDPPSSDGDAPEDRPQA